jgi:hypothetical protein
MLTPLVEIGESARGSVVNPVERRESDIGHWGYIKRFVHGATLPSSVVLVGSGRNENEQY